MTEDPTGGVRLVCAALAAVLAGLAAFGLVGRPASLLGRAHVGRPTRAAPLNGVPQSRLDRLGSGWAALRRPHPDALGPPVRGLLAAGVSVAAAVVSVLVGLRPGVGLVTGAVVAVLGFLFAGKVESPGARRRRERMIVELPHVLDLLAACLRAGLPLRAAARAVLEVSEGPLAEDLGLVVAQIDLGLAEPEAWRTLRAHPVLGRLAVDLARSVESGTMVVETLRQHARDARLQRRGALEARAKTVGVHSVPPLMVCFLPAFLLIGVVPTGVSAFLHALG